MSKHTKSNTPNENTQDMLIRVMTIARLLMSDKPKQNKQKTQNQ